MRCGGEAVGVLGIIIALANSPLSTVTALMQSLPLVLTIMGAVFLKEPIGWRRILALMAGLIGVLIIIKPGMAGFDVFATFTLLGVAGMAIRDFGTRIMPKEISTATLSFYGASTIFVTGFLMIVVTGNWTAPTWTGIGFGVGLVAFGSIGTLARVNGDALGRCVRYQPLPVCPRGVWRWCWGTGFWGKRGLSHYPRFNHRGRGRAL